MKELRTYLGGHPLSTNDYGWMQKSLKEVIGALGRMFLPSDTSACILEGVQVTSDGSTVTVRDFGDFSGWEDRPAGYVFLNGEVFEVVPGTVTAASVASCSLEIQELLPDNGSGRPDAGYPDLVAYQSGGNQQVYVNRKLVLVDNGDHISLTSLSYASNTAQSGTIVGFRPPSGTTLSDIVDAGTNLGIGRWRGWRRYNEADGRVLVGQLDGDADFGTIGDDGGVKEVTLTADQSGLPAHSHRTLHTGTAPNIGDGGSGQARNKSDSFDLATEDTGPLNAAEAHTNLQPYTTVVYMIKL